MSIQLNSAAAVNRARNQVVMGNTSARDFLRREGITRFSSRHKDLAQRFREFRWERHDVRFFDLPSRTFEGVGRDAEDFREGLTTGHLLIPANLLYNLTTGRFIAADKRTAEQFRRTDMVVGQLIVPFSQQTSIADNITFHRVTFPETSDVVVVRDAANVIVESANVRKQYVVRVRYTNDEIGQSPTIIIEANDSSAAIRSKIDSIISSLIGQIQNNSPKFEELVDGSLGAPEVKFDAVEIAVSELPVAGGMCGHTKSSSGKNITFGPIKCRSYRSKNNNCLFVVMNKRSPHKLYAAQMPKFKILQLKIGSRDPVGIEHLEKVSDHYQIGIEAINQDGDVIATAGGDKKGENRKIMLRGEHWLDVLLTDFVDELCPDCRHTFKSRQHKKCNQGNVKYHRKQIRGQNKRIVRREPPTKERVEDWDYSPYDEEKGRWMEDNPSSSFITAKDKVNAFTDHLRHRHVHDGRMFTMKILSKKRAGDMRSDMQIIDEYMDATIFIPQALEGVMTYDLESHQCSEEHRQRVNAVGSVMHGVYTDNIGEQSMLDFVERTFTKLKLESRAGLEAVSDLEEAKRVYAQKQDELKAKRLGVKDYAAAKKALKERFGFFILKAKAKVAEIAHQQCPEVLVGYNSSGYDSHLILEHLLENDYFIPPNRVRAHPGTRGPAEKSITNISKGAVLTLNKKFRPHLNPEKGVYGKYRETKLLAQHDAMGDGEKAEFVKTAQWLDYLATKAAAETRKKKKKLKSSKMAAAEGLLREKIFPKDTADLARQYSQTLKKELHPSTVHYYRTHKKSASDPRAGHLFSYKGLAYFITAVVPSLQDKFKKSPSFLAKGRKLMALTFNNVRSLDLCQYTTMGLAKLCKAFLMKNQKSFFPYSFAKSHDDTKYIGKPPPFNCFSPAARKEILELFGSYKEMQYWFYTSAREVYSGKKSAVEGMKKILAGEKSKDVVLKEVIEEYGSVEAFAQSVVPGEEPVFDFMKETRKYLKLDVLATQEAFLKVGKAMFLSNGLNIKDFITLPANAFAEWETTIPEETFVGIPTDEEEYDIASKSVYGGRATPITRYFKSSDMGKPYELINDYLRNGDFCSMYPKAMRDGHFQLGGAQQLRPSKISKLNRIIDEFDGDVGKFNKNFPFGNYRGISFPNKNLIVPPVGMKDENGNTVWDNISRAGQCYQRTDIIELIRHGGHFVVTAGFSFWMRETKKTKFKAYTQIFQKYVDNHFKKKQHQDSLIKEFAEVRKAIDESDDGSEKRKLQEMLSKMDCGNLALRKTEKDLLVSLFGKLMQKRINRSTMIITNPEEWAAFLRDYKWTDIWRISGDKVVVSGEAFNFETTVTRPVHLGAEVLAQSRVMVNDFLNALDPDRLSGKVRTWEEQQQNSIYYMACDSFTFHNRHWDRVKHMFVQPGQTKELGMLEDELDGGKIVEAIYLAPNTRAEKFVMPDGAIKYRLRAKSVPRCSLNWQVFEFALGNKQCEITEELCEQIKKMTDIERANEKPRAEKSFRRDGIDFTYKLALKENGELKKSVSFGMPIFKTNHTLRSMRQGKAPFSISVKADGFRSLSDTWTRRKYVDKERIFTVPFGYEQAEEQPRTVDLSREMLSFKVDEEAHELSVREFCDDCGLLLFSLEEDCKEHMKVSKEEMLLRYEGERYSCVRDLTDLEEIIHSGSHSKDQFEVRFETGYLPYVEVQRRFVESRTAREAEKKREKELDRCLEELELEMLADEGITTLQQRAHHAAEHNKPNLMVKEICEVEPYQWVRNRDLYVYGVYNYLNSKTRKVELGLWIKCPTLQAEHFSTQEMRDKKWVERGSNLFRFRYTMTTFGFGPKQVFLQNYRKFATRKSFFHAEPDKNGDFVFFMDVDKFAAEDDYDIEDTIRKVMDRYKKLGFRISRHQIRTAEASGLKRPHSAPDERKKPAEYYHSWRLGFYTGNCFQSGEQLLKFWRVFKKGWEPELRELGVDGSCYRKGSWIRVPGSCKETDLTRPLRGKAMILNVEDYVPYDLSKFADEKDEYVEIERHTIPLYVRQLAAEEKIGIGARVEELESIEFSFFQAFPETTVCPIAERIHNFTPLFLIKWGKLTGEVSLRCKNDEFCEKTEYFLTNDVGEESDWRAENECVRLAWEEDKKQKEDEANAEMKEWKDALVKHLESHAMFADGGLVGDNLAKESKVSGVSKRAGHHRERNFAGHPFTRLDEIRSLMCDNRIYAPHCPEAITGVTEEEALKTMNYDAIKHPGLQPGSLHPEMYFTGRVPYEKKAKKGAKAEIRKSDVWRDQNTRQIWFSRQEAAVEYSKLRGFPVIIKNETFLFSALADTGESYTKLFNSTPPGRRFLLELLPGGNRRIPGWDIEIYTDEPAPEKLEKCLFDLKTQYEKDWNVVLAPHEFVSIHASRYTTMSQKTHPKFGQRMYKNSAHAFVINGDYFENNMTERRYIQHQKVSDLLYDYYQTTELDGGIYTDFRPFRLAGNAKIKSPDKVLDGEAIFRGPTDERYYRQALRVDKLAPLVKVRYLNPEKNNNIIYVLQGKPAKKVKKKTTRKKVVKRVVMAESSEFDFAE